MDWGVHDIQWGNGASMIGNPFQYTGRRLDVTGKYYYRARYYDPDMGRFISQDPIGAWGDPANLGNAYAYVGGGSFPEDSPADKGWKECGP